MKIINVFFKVALGLFLLKWLFNAVFGLVGHIIKKIKSAKRKVDEDESE